MKNKMRVWRKYFVGFYYGVLLIMAIHPAQKVLANDVINNNQTKGNKMNENELEIKGKQLRAEIENRYQELRKLNQVNVKGKNRIEDIVVKYIPIGTSFDVAERILLAAGCNISPRPIVDPYGLSDKFSIVAGSDFKTSGFFRVTSAGFGITLLPSIPGVLEGNFVKAITGSISSSSL